MSAQVVFQRAVKHHVPSAFVSSLERIDEFKIGTVLLYHDKPHWWSWGKKELDFVGLPISELIAEEQRGDFHFQTESNVLFNETSDSSQRTINVDLDIDAEVCIYVPTYVCMYVCLDVCMYVCVCMYV